MIKLTKANDVITITGHANYDDYGKDIVCASVSAIVITTVNAILRLDKQSITYQEGKTLTIKILKKEENTLKLIDNMLSLLKELEQDYPENIKIKEE